MKAITIKQPFASAIMFADKVENRKGPMWSRLVGHWVGIHAGAAWHEDWREVERIAPDVLRNVPRGVLLGFAFVERVVRPEALPGNPWVCGLPWDAVIVFGERIPLARPIPMAGQLGMWNLVIPGISRADEEGFVIATLDHAEVRSRVAPGTQLQLPAA